MLVNIGSVCMSVDNKVKFILEINGAYKALSLTNMEEVHKLLVERNLDKVAKVISITPSMVIQPGCGE